MIAYVDSSVILRFVLQQPDPLLVLLDCDDRVTSFLTEVDCRRAIVAARLRRQLSMDESGERWQVAYRHLRRMRRLMPSLSILRRAGEPYPVELKTLDTVRLATALMWRDRRAPASSSRRTIVSWVAPPQRWASRSSACSQTGARRPQSLFARRWVEARLGAYWREAEGA